MKEKDRKAVIYTIGHSTRPIDEFISMLKDFHVHKLIDVRTIPKSGFNPQYNQETLSQSLANEKIDYEHMAGLGGLRHAKKDSINLGWRNASFRGYADYMQTESFENSLQELINEAQKKTVAIMCAEAVPWRCHRSLIADALASSWTGCQRYHGRTKGKCAQNEPHGQNRERKDLLSGIMRRHGRFKI